MKLTPTTNDSIKGNGLHVIANHEPLKNEPLIPPGFIVGPNPPVIEPTPVVMPTRKIALVGTAPSSRSLAPYNDPTWEIWVCSPGNMGSTPRVTRWFEIHGNMFWPENRNTYGQNYVNWLNQQQFPIFMQSKEWVPNAVIYPREEMIKEFGPDFFSSSFAWMMALAIHERVQEIALFGIDMASRDEYILQRPGFYFFKREAEKRGIKVWAPNESDIMTSPAQYGYSETTPFGRKLIARETEIRQRLDAMKAERDKVQHGIVYLEGALEDLDYIKNIWSGVDPRI